ncbi:amidohydrolase [Salinifilum ghardaiensis]
MRSPHADVAFLGGPVATMDAARSWTDAVAVRDGRIAALGRTAVDELVGPGTDLVDLRGRLLIPGFFDGHAHPIYGGLQRLRCDLTDSADARDALRRIRDYLRTHDPDWLLGGGWDPGHFPGGTPTREALDEVTGDRPAYLVNGDHHGAWVNTAALRLAGVDHNTPDPPDGRVERDEQGRPSGTLHEGATRLVARALPTTSTEEYLAALVEGQRYLQARGVVGWHDAIVGAYLGYGDTLETYLSADRRGLLTAKVRGALWWDRQRDTEQIDELRDRRERARGERFRADAVKIMQDGVCENFTASMLQPYLAQRDTGMSFVPRETLLRAVPLLDAEQFQLHFHAVGDRAVRDVLDAIALAREGSASGARHQIAHVQVVHPDDLARFRGLGVAATVQEAWAVNDAAMTELTVPHLGSRRSRWQYPFRSLRAAGAVLAAGSDWPVSEAEPLRALHVAVNRTDPDVQAEPFLPEQRLELVDALAAHTAGTAWVNHMEGGTGTVERGKAADLVVLDRDPFALDAAHIADCQVDLTMVDGRVVYERRTG